MHMNTFFSSYCWPHICLCQITSSLLAYTMPQCTTGFSPPFYDLGPRLRGMNGKRTCRDTFFSHTFPHCLCFFPSFLSVLFSDSSSTDMNTTHTIVIHGILPIKQQLWPWAHFGWSIRWSLCTSVERIDILVNCGQITRYFAMTWAHWYFG